MKPTLRLGSLYFANKNREGLMSALSIVVTVAAILLSKIHQNSKKKQLNHFAINIKAIIITNYIKVKVFSNMMFFILQNVKQALRAVWRGVRIQLGWYKRAEMAAYEFIMGKELIMAHLFNKTDYFDYRSRVYTNIKKTLEAKIQQLTDALPPNHLHPVEGQEDLPIDSAQVTILYEGQAIILPKKLLELNLADIINFNTIQNEFTEEEIKQLLPLLPNQDIQSLKHALEGKGLYEGHLQNFERKLKTGYFTTLREKEDEINQRLSEYRMKEIYQNLLKTIVNQRNSGMKVEKFTFEDEGSSVESLNDLSSIEDLSENSQATETEEEMDDFIDQEYNQRVFFRYDHTKIKGQEELLALGEEKIDKKAAMYKITLPVRPKNNEWVENYRRQEFQRYSNPTKPWVYACEDGRKVTVAPVAKKLSVLTGKPRDHPLLKSERPACVTILTLVRDAAARLPNGVGTRADISQLLKESQYVNEDLPEEKLSNIVSGALDRLHYMTDACVKYDSEKKLWLYLHSDRNYEHPGWGEDGEDYLDRVPPKKKKRDFQ